MKRRDLLTTLGTATGLALMGRHAPGWAQGVAQRATSIADHILILIELKGGNDGLNTLVPYADNAYYTLRNSIAIKAEDVIKIDTRLGLHPELKALLPLWEKNELAVVQGVGYPQPNLSHFRSIEIWESASKSNETLDDGWVARAMKAGYGATPFTAEGVLIGMNDFGPLAGARAVSLNNPEAFVNQARFASAMPTTGNAALRHLLQVENNISQAAAGLRGERFNFVTPFPQGAFGNSVRKFSRHHLPGWIPNLLATAGSVTRDGG